MSNPHDKYTVTGDGCWVWEGKLNTKGVPQYNDISAARVLWADVMGAELPRHLVLRSLCGLGVCVNPAHREPVTRPELGYYAGVASGVARLENPATHCARGHAYEGNTYIEPARGQRRCHECMRSKNARRYAA